MVSTFSPLSVVTGGKIDCDFVSDWFSELLTTEPHRVGVLVDGLLPEVRLLLFGSVGGFCISPILELVLGGLETPRANASDRLNLFKIGY